MRGRSKELIARRDQMLLRRYHYWTEVQRLRFDDALRVLSQREFFITEERIMDILRERCDEIRSVVSAPAPRVRKPRVTRGMLDMFETRPAPPPSGRPGRRRAKP